MSNMRRAKRLVALGVGLSLVAMACGGDDDDDATTATTAAEEGTETTTAETDAPATTEAASDTTAAGEEGEGGEGSAAPAGDAAMTITVALNPDAVWEDGSPITWEDVECTWQGQLNTPGSIETVGYDKISSVSQGADEKEVIIEFSEPYGPYKTLFNQDHQEGGRRRLHGHLGRLRNGRADLGPSVHPPGVEREPEHPRPQRELLGRRQAVTEQVVFVPQTDTDTEIASIKSGQVDYIYPQFGDTLGDRAAGPEHQARHPERRRLRGAVLPAARGPVRRRRLPRGVLDVDRPPGAVRPDLRPDLRVGRCRGRAAELRPDRRGSVLPRRASSRTPTTRRPPRSC